MVKSLRFIWNLRRPGSFKQARDRLVRRGVSAEEAVRLILRGAPDNCDRKE